MTTKAPREFWVPECKMYDSAFLCTDKNRSSGAAVLVVPHTDFASRVQELERENERFEERDNALTKFQFEATEKIEQLESRLSLAVSALEFICQCHEINQATLKKHFEQAWHPALKDQAFGKEMMCYATQPCFNEARETLAKLKAEGGKG